MSRRVAVSFEDDLVRIVYATESKGRLTVTRTLAVNADQFDAFLQKNRFPDLIVLYPFRKFYSDIIPVPPVKKKSHLDTIIRSEIKRRYNDLRSFTFFYDVMREKAAEEKSPYDAFFFVVDDAEVEAIVERFDRHGQKIKFLCPDVMALSYLFRSGMVEAPRTVIGLLASTTEKSLFLMRDGHIRFIRVTPSVGKDLQDTDIDNINMTVSYYQQHLRVTPEQLVLLNISAEGDAERITIPTVKVVPPPEISPPGASFHDYVIPLAAVAAGSALKPDNMLPDKFRKIYSQTSVMGYAAALFVFISVLAAGCIAYNLSEVSSMRKQIAFLRSEMSSEASVMAVYDQSAIKLQQMKPAINLIRDALSATFAQESLRRISLLPLEGIEVQSINISSEKESNRLEISGVIHMDDFGSRHKVFQKLARALTGNGESVMASQKIDLQGGVFRIAVGSNRP